MLRSRREDRVAQSLSPSRAHSESQCGRLSLTNKAMRFDRRFHVQYHYLNLSRIKSSHGRSCTVWANC